MKTRPNLTTLVGLTFNNMKVIGFSNVNRSKLEMLCHCGTKFLTRYDYIVKNKVLSCGCSKVKHLTDRNKSINYKRLPTEVAATNKLFSRYMKDAEKRNLEFLLSREEFIKLVKSKCTYCGAPPNQKIFSSRTTGILLYNGIDRIVNSLGYVISNCTPCCKRCNYLKGPQDGTTFLELIGLIATRNTLARQFKEHKLANYMERAQAVARNSSDAETQVGSLLIKADSGAVVADAYNGFCRGTRDVLLPKTRPEKYDYMIHSEANLIANCAKHGIATDGCVLVCTLSPCKICLRLIYQCGIKTVYFKEKYRDFQDNMNMKDLSVSLYSVGEFFKIEIEPAR